MLFGSLNHSSYMLHYNVAKRLLRFTTGCRCLRLVQRSIIYRVISIKGVVYQELNVTEVFERIVLLNVCKTMVMVKRKLRHVLVTPRT